MISLNAVVPKVSSVTHFCESLPASRHGRNLYKLKQIALRFLIKPGMREKRTIGKANWKSQEKL
jgi:hypothetical protein